MSDTTTLLQKIFFVHFKTSYERQGW